MRPRSFFSTGVDNYSSHEVLVSCSFVSQAFFPRNLAESDTELVTSKTEQK